VYRWYGLDDVPTDWAGCVATIGVFDGVHRGHQRVVARARQIAQEKNLPLVVITFDPHPDEVVRPGSHPPFLTTPRRQAELLAGLGAAAVLGLRYPVQMLPLLLDWLSTSADPDQGLLGLLLFLTLSGYLLYYAGGDEARAVISPLHWIVGLGAPALFVLHRFARERR